MPPQRVCRVDFRPATCHNSRRSCGSSDTILTGGLCIRFYMFSCAGDGGGPGGGRVMTSIAVRSSYSVSFVSVKLSEEEVLTFSADSSVH